MKFLFIIQGEGRGHLTQAMTLREILAQNGHEVVAVMVGKSNHRDLPDFFTQKIGVPVHRFDSPNFLPAAKNKKMNLWGTIAYNLARIPQYFRSILLIRKTIQESNVDLVVNFYDLLGGLTYALFPPKSPYVSVAHQYLFLHPGYQFPAESAMELYLLKFFTRMTCIRSSQLFALSIEKKDNVPAKKLTVVPPLLRSEVLNTTPIKGNYLHGYMLNPTYEEEIRAFQESHPDTFIHFFWDKKGAGKETMINDHLTFHALDDKLFIQYMAGCLAYATTAGFESVCEAIYLGKPVLMVPTHIEQCCNAYEAASLGAGIEADYFDLEALLAYAADYKENTNFHSWVQQAQTQWVKELEDILYRLKTKHARAPKFQPAPGPCSQ